jgi:lipoprotein NlpI
LHIGLTIWPGPIVPYLLGKLSQETLQAILEVAAKAPVLRERFQCQATFYHGVRGLNEGKQEIFQQAMRACMESSYGYFEFEYYLASWEVENQFPVISNESSVS